MLILVIYCAIARDIQHLVHGMDAYLMNQNNSFLQERALDTLLVSVSSILLDFLFNKLSKTKTHKDTNTKHKGKLVYNKIKHGPLITWASTNICETNGMTRNVLLVALPSDHFWNDKIEYCTQHAEWTFCLAMYVDPGLYHPVSIFQTTSWKIRSSGCT